MRTHPAGDLAMMGEMKKARKVPVLGVGVCLYEMISVVKDVLCGVEGTHLDGRH